MPTQKFYQKISDISRDTLYWCPEGCGKQLQHWRNHNQYDKHGNRIAVIPVYRCNTCNKHFNKIELAMENCEDLI